jgi:hypothetical protein
MVRPETSDGVCLYCKGARLLCGKKICPILKKASILNRVIPHNFEKLQRDKTLFGASPPAVFIGHYGYPNIYLGPMIPIDDVFLRESPELAIKDTSILDLSELWYGKDMDEIITYRTAMVRSSFKSNVNISSKTEGNLKLVEDIRDKMDYQQNKLLDSSQELAMAKNSVDTETTIDKLHLNMLFDIHSPPLGPSGITEKINIIDNVKVNPKVEYVVDDTDLKATDAITDYLYPTNLGEKALTERNSADIVTGTEMQRLMSMGLLGTKNKRRLVPTRWSITAVDSTISQYLIKKVKKLPEINEYYTFHEKYLDNNFVVLLIPAPWAYEMMEVWYADTIWTQDVTGVQEHMQDKGPTIVEDYELEKGRTNYASNITGAYYAARKEITEFLVRQGKQARVIVFREVSGGYLVPLGVWVIRETIRNALINGFNGSNVEKSDNLMIALQRINKEMKLNLKHWVHSSNLLKDISKQRRLDEWIPFTPRKIV